MICDVSASVSEGITWTCRCKEGCYAGFFFLRSLWALMMCEHLLWMLLCNMFVTHCVSGKHWVIYLCVESN